MEVFIKTGRTFYGICMITIGVLQFVYADFRTVIVPPWPSWRTNPVMAAYIAGALFIAAGITIIFLKKGKEVALVLGIVLLCLFVLWHLPYLLFIQPHAIKNLGLWAEASKAMALAGGAFVVAGSFLREDGLDKHSSTFFSFLEKLIPIGPILFSITMIEFGIDHFLYINYIATLVPTWIPGNIFWTYLAGAALIASGVAIVFKIKLKFSALSLSIIIFIWFIVLHIPRAIATPETANGNEIVSAGDALAFSGIALIIAFMGDYRRLKSSKFKVQS